MAHELPAFSCDQLSRGSLYVLTKERYRCNIISVQQNVLAAGKNRAAYIRFCNPEIIVPGRAFISVS